MNYTRIRCRVSIAPLASSAAEELYSKAIKWLGDLMSRPVVYCPGTGARQRWPSVAWALGDTSVLVFGKGDC